MFQQRDRRRRNSGRATAATSERDERVARVITDVAAVEALAYPLRQELLDTVTAFGGEAAASALAEHLGRPVDGLYYHLRLLVKHGLLDEEVTRNQAGRKERRYRLAGDGRGAPRLAYRPTASAASSRARTTGAARAAGAASAASGKGGKSSQARAARSRARDEAKARARNDEALRKVVSGMMRIAGRDFNAALADDEVAVEGKRRQLWAARNKGWVSGEELEELNRLLGRLLELFDRPRSEERQHLMSLCFVLAPVAARPKRRA